MWVTSLTDLKREVVVQAAAAPEGHPELKPIAGRTLGGLPPGKPTPWQRLRLASTDAMFS